MSKSLELTKFVTNVLNTYSDDNISLIDNYIRRNLVRTIDRLIADRERSVKLKEESEIVIKNFCENFAYLSCTKRYFYLRGDEWEHTIIDQVYDKWCCFLKELFIDKEIEDNGIQIYSGRRSLFRIVKKTIRSINILDKTPGSLLIRKTRRVFKHIGLKDNELTYLFSFLGSCIYGIDYVFKDYLHVWHGYKINDILNLLRGLIGINPYFKNIRHNIPINFDYNTICCIHFPHQPHSRRLFYQGVSTLPMETRMVFTYAFREYSSNIFPCGSLVGFTDAVNVLDEYLSKSCKSSASDFVYVSEFYEDFRDYLYQKGIPRSLLSTKEFKNHLCKILDKVDNDICFVKVAFVTKHAIFNRFCSECYNNSELLKLDENIHNDIYKKYINWVSNVRDEVVIEHYRIDNFIATRKEIKEFLHYSFNLNKKNSRNLITT